MRNLKLTIAYDGTRYHGWQAQDGVSTVEGALRDALAGIMEPDATLSGASRTDRGVHAAGQVASLVTSCTIPPSRLVRALNGRLPLDVRLVSAEEVAAGFHARFDAYGKHYRYLLWRGSVATVFLSPYTLPWSVELDLPVMRTAAAELVGEHDFASFQGAAGRRENSVRRLDAIRIEEQGPFVQLDFWGRSFLYKMVRSLVGTLLEIGRGRWSPGRAAEILAARDRRQGGPTAAARGLTLVAVHCDPATYRASIARPPAVLDVFCGGVLEPRGGLRGRVSAD